MFIYVLLSIIIIAIMVLRTVRAKSLGTKDDLLVRRLKAFLRGQKH